MDAPATNREEGPVRFPLIAAALAGLAAGCTEEWNTLKPSLNSLKPPPGLIKLDTWTTVPEGQRDIQGRVGDVFHLSLGKAMDRTQLGWLRVVVNSRVQENPEFDGDEPSSYVFRAERAGHYRLEIRREVAGKNDQEEHPEAEPEPPRKVDSTWPPRFWNITITE
jgi:hypothetical protein